MLARPDRQRRTPATPAARRRRLDPPGRPARHTARPFADPAIHDAPLDLAPGDILLIYTDGLPEGRGIAGFYGEQRIHATVRQPHQSAASLVNALLGDALAFQGNNPRDDIAMVAVRAHR